MATTRESSGGPLEAQAYGGPATLAAVAAAILEADDIEEWQRDMLLTEVRSLDEFYRTRSGSGGQTDPNLL